MWRVLLNFVYKTRFILYFVFFIIDDDIFYSTSYFLIDIFELLSLFISITLHWPIECTDTINCTTLCKPLNLETLILRENNQRFISLQGN